MRWLITGIGGFVGSYLAELLLTQGVEVFGTIHEASDGVQHLRSRVSLLGCDVLDQSQVRQALESAHPDVVVHLAARSHIPASWQDPEATLRTNVLGTLNLLGAVRDSGLAPLVMLAGSSTEYGPSRDGSPLHEETPVSPSSPYAISKAAATLLARSYAKAFGLKTIVFRPFQFIGPRKLSDASSSFACGIVKIERGEQTALSVGNLEAVRDVMDVRDGVRAIWLIATEGEPGKVYNISSGQGHRVQELLDTLISLSHKRIGVVRDPRLLRPVDEPAIVGDNTRIRRLGWRNEVSLEASLRDILDYWRERWTPSAANFLGEEVEKA